MNFRQRIVLTIAMLSYLLTAMSNCLVITGLTKIATDLRLDQVGLSWVQNAYGLAFGSFLLLSGRLSDAFSRRRILNIALAIFLFGSLLSGLATSGGVMIAARFLQGLGSALLAPTSMALLIDYFEGPALVKAIAWYSSVSGLGASIGLVLGGLFASLWSWRLGFYLNVPVCLLMLALSWRTFEESATSQTHERFDLLGTLTSVLACSLLVWGLNGASHPVLVLALAMIFLIAFVVIEHRSQSPLLPLRIFKNGVRTNGYLCRAILNGAVLGYWFFVSEYLQQVLHYSPLKVGFAYLPLSVTLFLAAMVVPRLINAWNDKGVLILASLTMLAGFGLALVMDGRGYWLGTGLPMLILGCGQGLALAPTTNMGIYQVPAEHSGTASGLVNVAHQLGGVLGLAVMVNLGTSLVSAGDVNGQFRVAMIVALAMMTLTFLLAILAGKEEAE
ncbi:MFS transporter [Limosilactobacillus sp.]|jgi:EmrB/QacA subfamily drug resistance transporter|uniref:MFS transporter n=1 Tax=Limosilactobacillus sp. TaxID=2773925 RepID=UPI0025C02BB0|nr:MFS transporter [Limosilactobacillus sp.]MCH3922871.1 MFS transporter [Limosilactobacillus sp.]MCH3927554.1 MFS transporter [Limosilactobacillus sp.]